MFSKTFFNDSLDKFHDDTDKQLMGRSLLVREWSLSGLMSIHKVASLHVVRIYPILSEKVKSLAKWV